MFEAARHGRPWMVVACLALAGTATAGSVPLDAPAPHVAAPSSAGVGLSDLGSLLDSMIASSQSDPDFARELIAPATSSPMDLLGGRPKLVVAFLSAGDVIALWGDAFTPAMIAEFSFSPLFRSMVFRTLRWSAVRRNGGPGATVGRPPGLTASDWVDLESMAPEDIGRYARMVAILQRGVESQDRGWSGGGGPLVMGRSEPVREPRSSGGGTQASRSSPGAPIKVASLAHTRSGDGPWSAIIIATLWAMLSMALYVFWRCLVGR